MPIPLIFRTTDLLRWGLGKDGPGDGTDLTPLEVDENFWTLWEMLTDLESEPIQPFQISAINVVGNQMTIHLDDGLTVFGPFTLPTAAFDWKDEYEGGVEYKTWDFFTANEGVYLVLQDFESATEFNPNDGNINGPFARLVFPYPNLYDIGFSFPGTPGLGIEAGEAMFTFVAVRPFYLRAEEMTTLARATLQRSAAAEMVCPVFKNQTEIGTITLGGGSTESEAEPELDAVFTFADDVQFVSSDRLRVLRPDDLDTNAKDLAVVFPARKGTL